jgi:hypothetical protein
MQPITEPPDYEKLRAILVRQLGHEVSLEYAVGAGNFLINVYEVLLSDDSGDQTEVKSDKITNGHN